MKELEELEPNEVLDLQDKVKDKLEEIEDSIEDIIKIGDVVIADRRKAFDSDMSPEQIRQFGIKNRLPKACLLYTSPSPRDLSTYRMPSSA